MINWESVEKFVLSKTALLTGSIIVIIVLANAVNNRDNTIASERKQHVIDLAAKDAEKDLVDSKLYDCQQQQKIDADNSIKAAQQMAAEYKGLWMEYVDIKTEAKKKNIIK